MQCTNAEISENAPNLYILPMIDGWMHAWIYALTDPTDCTHSAKPTDLSINVKDETCILDLQELNLGPGVCHFYHCCLMTLLPFRAICVILR